MKQKLISIISALIIGIGTIGLFLTTLSVSAVPLITTSTIGYSSVNNRTLNTLQQEVSNTIYLPFISKPSLVELAGGTYFDSFDGLIGTGFVMNPTLANGQSISHIDIRGPNGWNSNQVFQLNLYQPNGIAQNRSVGWAFTPPISGIYTSTAQIMNGQPVTSFFSIDASSQITAPLITNVVGSVSQVSVDWSATSEMRSFLVRLERVPFDGVIAETVVAGSERSLTFNGLSLTSGTLHRVVIFAFYNDIKTPGSVTSPADLSADSETFTP